MKAIAPNGKTYTLPAYKEASVRAPKQDAYAPGQFVTLDLYGGQVDAMVMWRSDELVYRKGSAYRVKVLRDRRTAVDVTHLPFNRMVLVHEGQMSPVPTLRCPECELGLGTHNLDSPRCDHHTKS